ADRGRRAEPAHTVEMIDKWTPPDYKRWRLFVSVVFLRLGPGLPCTGALLFLYRFTVCRYSRPPPSSERDRTHRGQREGWWLSSPSRPSTENWKLINRNRYNYAGL